MNLEGSLKDALDTPGQVVSLSGPSKSGKTVLVERVVGRDYLIPITGAGIQEPGDLWNRVLDWMDAPDLRTTKCTTSGSVGAELGAGGAARFLGILSAEGNAKGKADVGHARKKASKARRQVEVPPETKVRIYEQTTPSTDFRSLVDVLDAGPKTRGTERKIYKFTNGSEGDVYRCIMSALAENPPRLSFSYDELTARVRAICQGDVPVGSSVIGTCLHMGKLALEKFPGERAIDWDEQKLILDIPDPFLLFYLRWSGRLQEP